MKYNGLRSADPRKDEKAHNRYVALVIVALFALILFIVKYFPGW